MTHLRTQLWLWPAAITITKTYVLWGMAVAHCDRYTFVTVSLLKLLRDGRFASEKTARRFQK
jgi:hypothetical protein